MYLSLIVFPAILHSYHQFRDHFRRRYPIGGEPGSYTRLHRFRVYAIRPIRPPLLSFNPWQTAMVSIAAVPS